MADIDTITDNLIFHKTFIACSLFTPGGKKGKDVVIKDR